MIAQFLEVMAAVVVALDAVVQAVRSLGTVSEFVEARIAPGRGITVIVLPSSHWYAYHPFNHRHTRSAPVTLLEP